MDRPSELLRSGLTCRSACSVLTLFAYAAVTVGLPMEGELGSQCAGSRCTCSQDVQDSGECCCSLDSVVAGRSCFGRNAARSHTSNQRAVNACCSSKIAESQPVNNRSCSKSGGWLEGTPPSRHVVDSDGACDPHAGQFGIPTIVNACNCGNDSAVGFCCNAEPRLPGDSVNVLPGRDLQSKCEFACKILPHHINTPETPPPEVSVA